MKNFIKKAGLIIKKCFIWILKHVELKNGIITIDLKDYMALT